MSRKKPSFCDAAIDAEVLPHPTKNDRRTRKVTPLNVEGDVPQLDSIASWERELLLPFVNQLVDALDETATPTQDQETDEQADEQAREGNDPADEQPH